MPRIGPEVKTFALEHPFGRLAFAGLKLAQTARARTPFERGVALLEGWRGTDFQVFQRRSDHFLGRALTRAGELVPLNENPLLQAYVTTEAARAIRNEFSGFDLADRVRMRAPRPAEPAERQGDLILLKAPDPQSGEKGVLLIKYSDSIARFPALFRVEELVRHYMVVLEPSWWGYQDATLFLYAGLDARVVVQAQAERDYHFLERHGRGLVPARIGAGDWIDAAQFTPDQAPKNYDVVMVSSWNPFKRHADLLAALREARERHGRLVTAALIGYPSGWTADKIREMVREHGLEDQCEVIDQVPQSRVANVVSRSRLYVLLSRREGANKAMYEAMFCDTPVLAPRDHRGINHDHLNERTGLSFNRSRLTEALLEGLERSPDYAPREWALHNTGYENATRLLEAALAGLAERHGEPWRRPIAPKKNRPNLWYSSDEDRRRLEPAYDQLVQYLRPLD